MWRLTGGVLITVIAAAFFSSPAAGQANEKSVRVGMIGLDTSHSIAFTKILNDENADEDVAGFRVTAAYPHGSADIESSVSRIPEYTEEIKQLGVKIVDSIEALLEEVDVVLLETNDGRLHFEQALKVFRAGKPVFIDKPIAASLTDAIAIFEAARHFGVPVFSASSLRYLPKAQAVRAGEIGRVLGADTFSPSPLEPTHPDLFWYGIHGVETLYTVMGTGCESVVRVTSEGTDVVVGKWNDGRIGTFRGIREGKTGYGGMAFGSDGITELAPYEGYRALIVEIAKFFRTGVEPVSPEETIEIFAFMEAADESIRRGGVPVTLQSVMEEAQKEAKQKLATL